MADNVEEIVFSHKTEWSWHETRIFIHFGITIKWKKIPFECHFCSRSLDRNSPKNKITTNIIFEECQAKLLTEMCIKLQQRERVRERERKMSGNVSMQKLYGEFIQYLNCISTHHQFAVTK